MRSFTEPSFWDAYRRLPEQVQRRARESHRFFVDNPNHPSLEFKRVGEREPIYSARVSYGYRALGVLDQGDIIWFWIGPHHEYDLLLNRMRRRRGR